MVGPWRGPAAVARLRSGNSVLRLTCLSLLALLSSAVGGQIEACARLDRVGRLTVQGTGPAKVDRIHGSILRQAGRAKIRPRGA